MTQAMNEREPLLKIRFDGKAVGAGKIPVSHLLCFLSGMKKALQRTGRVLKGNAESMQRGRLPRGIREEVEFTLVQPTYGSPVAILGFERVTPLPGGESGLGVLEKAIDGLAKVQTVASEGPLPAGCDVDVLKAWRDVGTLFRKGISKVEFTLHRQTEPVVTVFTPDGLRCIQKRIQARTQMPQRQTGFGEAKTDAVSSKIADNKVCEVERLDDRENEATDPLPQGTPISQDFWESPSLDELAKSQHIQPMANAQALFGTWPGDENDGFEAAIDELRHSGTKRDNPL